MVLKLVEQYEFLLKENFYDPNAHHNRYAHHNLYKAF